MAVDLTVRRTARQALRTELQSVAPTNDEMGIGRIIMYLQVIAER